MMNKISPEKPETTGGSKSLQEDIESIKSKVEKSVLYSISADPGGTILLTTFENGHASGIELSQGMLKQMVKELSRYVR